jgi:hypothetical protein
MTPASIISTARYILNDTKTPYRQSDAELLTYVNQVLREASIINPALFSSIGDFTCEPGKCEQSISYLDAAALMEVLCIHDGAALTPFDLGAMNSFNPSWRTDIAGAAQQWTKFANDPLKFYIYPKAPVTAQVLDIRYVRVPTEYGLNDQITDLPSTYESALADGVVGFSESKDSEHVLSQRAQAHKEAFIAKIKG